MKPSKYGHFRHQNVGTAFVTEYKLQYVLKNEDEHKYVWWAGWRGILCVLGPKSEMRLQEKRSSGTSKSTYFSRQTPLLPWSEGEALWGRAMRREDRWGQRPAHRRPVGGRAGWMKAGDGLVLGAMDTLKSKWICICLKGEIKIKFFSLVLRFSLVIKWRYMKYEYEHKKWSGYTDWSEKWRNVPMWHSFPSLPTTGPVGSGANGGRTYLDTRKMHGFHKCLLWEGALFKAVVSETPRGVCCLIQRGC